MLPVDARDADLLVELRTAFDAAGYRADALRALVDPHRELLEAVGPVSFARLRLGASPIDVFVRLFSLRVPVPAADAVSALGSTLLEVVTELGLVAVRDGLAVPRMAVAVTHDVRIIGDLSGEPAGFDHVNAMSHTSDVCVQLTRRAPVGAVLDLGCGSGVQAVLAADHARRVVATDINPRALELTQRNAVLNGRDNIEVRRGDRYEPVVGERFDLIVCNAPYVVSPDHAFAYRDGPDDGDDFTAAVVRGLREHLAPGGRATVTGSWIERQEESPSDRIRAWLGSELDAVVLTARALDPETHAALWNVGADVDATIARWSAHACTLGAVRIHEGAIVVRQRAGTRHGWFHTEPLGPLRTGVMAAHVEDMLDNGPLLETLEDDELLDRRIALASRTRLQEEMRLLDGAMVTVAGRVTTRDGVEVEALVDPFTLDVLRRLDGKASVRERLLELAPDAVDNLVVDAASIVREMAASGLLTLRDATVSV